MVSKLGTPQFRAVDGNMACCSQPRQAQWQLGRSPRHSHFLSPIVRPIADKILMLPRRRLKRSRFQQRLRPKKGFFEPVREGAPSYTSPCLTVSDPDLFFNEDGAAPSTLSVGILHAVRTCCGARRALPFGHKLWKMSPRSFAWRASGPVSLARPPTQTRVV
jgi:hypothetical protein